ncbi:hypothetical protein ABFS82_11G078100 [Erythranthe guttata]|uniref:NAB domain-containing protein n=1 Tax=Erythranthe guttata TaxID=4155 RepID=A0A022RBG7_ERYGU|nr:PREDICTED: protein NETWORKED 3A-like [Erythranthe guttata]EYU37359.1 hypothetical protein MIMGU_mgv1a019520mg [Erythranthe guttata]|eukprot:XP_012837503.1 PREDICTED: protein NETWORKED 3A-like [Erythranthe guttata]
MENNSNSTAEVEEEQPPPPPSPFSRWSDSRNRPPHSQWLHSTLAELDDKIKMILDLIEDDGETFAKRAEMYYEKKPQLIKMVQELHKSYRSLADKYDQLKSDQSSVKASNNNNTNNGSLSDSFRKLQSLQHKRNLSPIKPPNFNSESVEEFSAEQAARSDESGTSSFGHESPKNDTPVLSVDSSNNYSMRNEDSEYYSDKNEMVVFRREKEIGSSERSWSNEPIKFSKLLEENLSTQAELIRRNDEKREVINELRNEKRIILSHNASGDYSSSSRSSSRNNNVTKKGKNQTQKRNNLRGLFCMA